MIQWTASYYMHSSYTHRVRRVVNLLQGKWTIEILCAIRTRPMRFNELRRAIPSASKKALAATLKSLQRSQIVRRRDLSQSVLHVEYSLADPMREPMAALLDHLADWSESHDSMDETRMVSSTEIRAQSLIDNADEGSASDQFSEIAEVSVERGLP